MHLDEGKGKVERVKDGVGGDGWSRSDFRPRLRLRQKITVFISAAPRRNRGGSHCCVKSLGAQKGRQKEREREREEKKACVTLQNDGAGALTATRRKHVKSLTDACYIEQR